MWTVFVTDNYCCHITQYKTFSMSTPKVIQHVADSHTSNGLRKWMDVNNTLISRRYGGAAGDLVRSADILLMIIHVNSISCPKTSRHTHTHLFSHGLPSWHETVSAYINTISIHTVSWEAYFLSVLSLSDQAVCVFCEEITTNAWPAQNNSVFPIICCENSPSGGLPAPTLHFPHCKSWWNGLQVSGLKNTLKWLWATDTVTAASLLLPVLYCHLFSV